MFVNNMGVYLALLHIIIRTCMPSHYITPKLLILRYHVLIHVRFFVRTKNFKTYNVTVFILMFV